MSALASLLLSTWHLASLPGAVRFAAALRDPRQAQLHLLRRLLRHDEASDFGRRHGFHGISGPDAFRTRVPLARWQDVEADVARIRAGEVRVLGSDLVTRLVPTSGSGSVRKLVPWNVGLQRAFAAGLAPWITDLNRRWPAIRGGPAYWSITPPCEAPSEDAAVPIGFDDDTAYLGGGLQRLVAPCLAVPSDLRLESDPDAFRQRTLIHLLACRDLRFISVWHPSFLALLLDVLERDQGRLVAAIARLDPVRARELERAGLSPRRIWPRLALVSCWCDGPAVLPAHALVARLDGVPMQGKGLLATEGVVSIPFAGQHPLALTSHVIELLGDDGRCRWAWELRPGDEGEVVLTTGGGLWRYRLGDRVRVDGMVGQTPSLRFLGRSGCAHDLAGEKIDEALAAEAIATLPGAAYAMLQPVPTPPHYRLWLPDGYSDPVTAVHLCEERLQRAHHYALARRLGQLGPLAPVRCALSPGELLVWLARQRGQRLGEVKPPALLPVQDSPPER